MQKIGDPLQNWFGTLSIKILVLIVHEAKFENNVISTMEILSSTFGLDVR